MIAKHATEQTTIFLSVIKWVFLSSVVGIIIGVVVSIFLKTIAWAEIHQSTMPFNYYYTLPFVFMFTVWLVKTFAPNAEGHGTEKVIEAVHKHDGKIDIAVIPVKLLATVMTIFAGGSVGKEGPGAQIGAGTASFIATSLKFRKQDRRKIVICGISAGFAAVFGTPIAGAIFGVEVLIIGVIMYDVLLPSFIAGFAAFTTTQFLGVEYTYFDVRFYQSIALDVPLILQVILAGIFFGIISDFLVTALAKTHKAIKNLSYSPYTKAFVGGTLLVVLTLIFGERYLGLGMGTIGEALSPSVDVTQDLPWYTFVLKTIFTSITLAVGGSGGIITPVFYVGATSGNLFGHLIGSEHIALFAALGFVSVLSGATNAPIAATIMAVELFGLEIAHYAAISAIISFLLTGHKSVFSSQKLGMKKSDALSIHMGEDIQSADVTLEDKEASKIQSITQRLKDKRDALCMTKNCRRKKQNKN